MKMTLGEIASLVGGQLHGDAEIEVGGTAILRDAGPDDLTLADDPKLVTALDASPAAAVLVPASLEPTGHPYITVDDVHASFAQVIQRFRPPRQLPPIGISPAAQISPSAKIADDAQIHPGAVIGDQAEIGAGATIHAGACVMAGCRVGAGSTLFPNAVLYEDTIVGPRCTIHAAAVIGSYGFGYRTIEGRHERGAQLGYVEIEADVEIGAGTTIDRGTYGPTRIGAGTKIDNQVQIGHNCRIGRHNLICSQVGIAGSAVSGDYVVMAGQVGIADHIRVGDQAVLGAKAGVMHEVPRGETWTGIPATDVRQQFQLQANFRKLPEMRRQLRELARRLPEAPNAQKPNAQKPNAQKPNAQKPNAQKPNAQKPDGKKPDAEARQPETGQPDTSQSDAA